MQRENDNLNTFYKFQLHRMHIFFSENSDLICQKNEKVASNPLTLTLTAYPTLVGIKHRSFSFSGTLSDQREYICIFYNNSIRSSFGSKLLHLYVYPKSQLTKVFVPLQLFNSFIFYRYG